MLKGLFCQNYRSLENFTLPLGPYTVLAGANGAGKSTALRAIDFLLGERWPSLSYLDIPYDFTDMDPSRPLLVRAEFDEPLLHEDDAGSEHKVHFVQYVAQPYKVRRGNKRPGDLRDQYLPLGANGETLTHCVKRPTKGVRPQYAPLVAMTMGLREQARVLSVSENRAVAAHQPGRRNHNE